MDNAGTVGESLVHAIEHLEEAGVESPGVDARLLMAEALSNSLGSTFGHMDVALYTDRPAPDVFQSWIERRITREPLQHILGYAPFHGLTITLGPGAFIPRPETELLVDWAVDYAFSQLEAKGFTGHYNILDLCCGPGTVGLACAHGLAQRLFNEPSELSKDFRISVRGIDISQTALKYAHTNAQALEEEFGAVHIDYDCIQADILQMVGYPGELKEWSDLVLCNPPYVPELTDHHPTVVSVEVQQDPHEAVFSGDTGMDFLDELIPHLGALCRQSSSSACALEHDESTGPNVRTALKDAGWSGIVQHEDFTHRPRFVTAHLDL